MKHSFFVLGAITILASSCSKDPDPVPGETPISIVAQQSEGGNAADQPFSVAKTPDGGYIVAGFTASTSGDIFSTHGSFDAVVIKYDANHNRQWKKVYGGGNTEYVTSIICTPDGGYIFTGATSSNDGDATGSGVHGGDDVWVVKLDAIGNIQWQKAYGGTLSDIGKSIALCPDGGYVIAGAAESSNGDITVNKGGHDCLVMKINTTGTLQWLKTLGGSKIDQANGVVCNADGSIVMAGTFRMADGDVTHTNGWEDMWVVKLNATGNMLWQKNYGSTNFDQGNAIVAVAGGYVITGVVQGDGGDVIRYKGNGDIWTFAIDETGKILWQNTTGGSNYDVGYSIAVTTDGSLFITGLSDSNDGDMTVNKGNSDITIIKLSNTGKLLWQKNLGSSSTDQGKGIIPFGSRGCVVAGYTSAKDGDVTSNSNPGNNEWWIPVLQ